MVILPDSQLEILLASANTEQLHRLAAICHIEYVSKHQSLKTLSENIIVHIQFFSSTPRKSRKKGHGELYIDTLSQVCKRLKIKNRDYQGGDIAAIEWKMLNHIISGAENLPLSVIEEQINKKIDSYKPVDKQRWKDYIPEGTVHKPPYLTKAKKDLKDYINETPNNNSKENCDDPYIEYIIAPLTGAAMYVTLKQLEYAFRWPLYEIIEPAVLYISFLRIFQKTCQVANEVGG